MIDDEIVFHLDFEALKTRVPVECSDFNALASLWNSLYYIRRMLCKLELIYPDTYVTFVNNFSCTSILLMVNYSLSFPV
jgi:hypothetical protein